jgi:hypothetical protein
MRGDIEAALLRVRPFYPGAAASTALMTSPDGVLRHAEKEYRRLIGIPTNWGLRVKRLGSALADPALPSIRLVGYLYGTDPKTTGG